MKSVLLLESGVANIPVSIAALDGVTMPQRRFLVDTGATKTTIPKAILTSVLGYTDEHIQSNMVVLPETDKPHMANGERADVYKLKAPRMNIEGHEIQLDYILTSDTISSLGLLLGLDVLSYFKFTYDFDAIDNEAQHGRMFFEFRKSRLKQFTKLGEPFAYNLGESVE